MYLYVYHVQLTVYVYFLADMVRSSLYTGRNKHVLCELKVVLVPGLQHI